MAESKLFHEIASLRTEQKNPRTELIDIASTQGILELINNEDLTVAQAVRNELKDIEAAVDLIVSAFKSGGLLFYFGAGTSGRLGILDASECPPTFGTNPEMVQGIIAGGEKAVFKAQEGAEDSKENGAIELDKDNIKPPDIICGIAASGRTPFVAGALEEAKKRNIRTILVSTVSKETVNELGIVADVLICANVGPEVITGSTRMKSGTATKMILNMLTTASMIKLGKTYGNVMVDLQLTNNKLLERAKRIIMQIAECDYDTATHFLELSGGHVKTALVMILGNLSKHEATELLSRADGFVRKALK